MKNQIEIIARAVIMNRGRILFCRLKKANYYFLPGGHVKSGEKTKQALHRELKEELRLLIKNPEFIGAVENFYKKMEKQHHEINLVFYSQSAVRDAVSKEGHIQFKWIDIKLIPKTKVLPIALKTSLLRWLKNKQTFWASQN